MASGSPDFFKRTFITGENVEQNKASVTDSDTALIFSQKVKAWIVSNDGPNAVHINFETAATTDHFKIPARGFMMLAVPLTELHFICASGETATVFAIGVL